MKKIPYFDSHCDTMCRCIMEKGVHLDENDGQLDLKRGRQFSKYAQIFNFYALSDELSKIPDLAQHEFDIFHAEMERNGALMTQCRTAEEIRATVAAGKCAAMASIEGAGLIDCDPGRLEQANRWGVKMINITWNIANVLAGTQCEDPERGLSAQGREFVKEAKRQNILMDVSHLSDPAFWDLVEMAEAPIVASHSNARAVYAHARNLTDDQFRAIVQSGGVVGLNYYMTFVGKDAGIDKMIEHLEHFLDLGGEKHIGFGGDLDGCDPLIHGFTGLESIQLLWQALEARGYPQALLEDLFFENWLRLM